MTTAEIYNKYPYLRAYLLRFLSESEIAKLTPHEALFWARSLNYELYAFRIVRDELFNAILDEIKPIIIPIMDGIAWLINQLPQPKS